LSGFGDVLGLLLMLVGLLGSLGLLHLLGAVGDVDLGPLDLLQLHLDVVLDLSLLQQSVC
jgi:hypothetical protein